ncbi:hypothetical protein GWI33_019885 [Rhynchophorus ferrugineus]|uniref:Uncharacterized protein n=1 Tax=Rhynchophorus ferrugineus TaxID=354439 RepID=A0A834I4I8_RHYFE|nr:hypothetical protein GWI33_019885 [Rhynchophorus ferrugineus]
MSNINSRGEQKIHYSGRTGAYKSDKEQRGSAFALDNIQPRRGSFTLCLFGVVYGVEIGLAEEKGGLTRKR